MTKQEITALKSKLNITLHLDGTPENPLDMIDDVSIVYSGKSRYILGNEEVSDITESLMDLLNYSDEYRNRLYNTYDEYDLYTYLLERMNKSGFIALPVYAYIHGNSSIATTPFNCRFDSGLSGYIYVSRETYRKNFEVKRINTEKVTNRLEGIIETFNAYLNGEVYGYTIEDDNENELDSCWGFYGDSFREDMAGNINAQNYNLTDEELKIILDNTEVKEPSYTY